MPTTNSSFKYTSPWSSVLFYKGLRYGFKLNIHSLSCAAGGDSFHGTLTDPKRNQPWVNFYLGSILKTETKNLTKSKYRKELIE